MGWGKRGRSGWGTDGDGEYGQVVGNKVSFSLFGLREVVPGGILRTGGKVSYDAAMEGFYVGIPEDAGHTVFGIGDDESYMRWDKDNGLVIVGDGSGMTQIDGGNIITGTVTADAIATGTITSVEIAAGTITTDNIAAGTIVAGDIEVGTLSFEQLTLGMISDNLVQDNGFETGTGAVHDGVGTGGAWAVQGTVHRSGAYGLQYDPTGQIGTAHYYLNGNPSDAGYIHRHVSVLEGREYTFEAYGYRAVGASCNVVRGYTRWYGSDGGVLAANYTTWNPADWADATWTLETSTKTAPAGAAYVVWDIAVLNSGNPDKVYFDDVVVRTVIGASLIQANAITAEKINVDTLSAIAVNVGSVNVDDTITIDIDGGIYQGTGTFVSPMKGLKIYNSFGFGVIESFNAGNTVWIADQGGFAFRAQGWQGLRWENDAGIEIVTSFANSSPSETSFGLRVTAQESDDSSAHLVANGKARSGGEEVSAQMSMMAGDSPHAILHMVSDVYGTVLDALRVQNYYDGEFGSAEPVDGIGAAVTLEATTAAPVGDAVKAIGAISGSWRTADDATRKGELAFTVNDSAGEREGMRIRSDGSAPMVSFYAETPVVRPGATDEIKAALVSLGLLQGTSATALNLDGGVLTAGGAILGGDLEFTGGGLTYGEMGVTENSTETAIGAIGTPVQVTVFDVNGPSNNLTPDHTSDHIQIVNSGDYMVSVGATINSVAGSASRFELEVLKNNGASAVGSLRCSRNIGGGGATAGVTPIMGLASLVAGDTIEVWITNSTNTTNYIVENMTLSLMQIGG
ncbi:MAG: hypothetical protein GY753_12785 [Gammaproteobacteria bacterium]|nr:hypothetical protein [Gammaproteobacteria bacterium]